MKCLRIFFCLLISLLWIAQAGAEKSLKIFIALDMEGTVGAVTDQQLGPGGFEYQRFREFATAEVNACIAAVREVGDTEILVSDAHGNAQNLLIEKLPADVKVVRSWPRPLGAMQGIDESFDGAIMLGFHSATTNTRGIRAHTFSSAYLTSVKLNDIPMSEVGFFAAVAGHFGVPVIMVSGDDAVVAETKQLLGDVEGAVVKWAHSFHSATTLTPQAGYKVIQEKTKAAIKRIAHFKPYRPEKPIELEVSMKNYRPVEVLSYLPVVDRVDSHTIRFVGKDMVQVSKFIEVMNGYSISLTP